MLRAGHGLLRGSRRPRVYPQRSPPFRTLSFSPTAPDRVHVPVGSSGSIALDIHHAPAPTHAAPAIVYLPRGPIGADPSSSTSASAASALPPEPASLAPLALAANVTVVRVHYRAGRPAHAFPRPVHDAAAGYDWVLRHLVRADNGHADLDRAFGRVGLAGELLGGSLAAALALTEGRVGRAGARAAALGNPVADWTAMYPVAGADPAVAPAPALRPLQQRATRARKSSSAKGAAAGSSWDTHGHSGPLSAAALLKTRRALFAAPEDYFDPFASPTLFFKTAATDAPAAAGDPIDEVFAELDLPFRRFERKRRAARRWPPADARLRLPDWRVGVGERCALRDQGIELAQGVARSNMLHGGADGRRAGGDTGWERVEVQVRPGLGLWGERELAELGRWFGERLRIDNT